jgi:hypothetical protein
MAGSIGKENKGGRDSVASFEIRRRLVGNA